MLFNAYSKEKLLKTVNLSILNLKKDEEGFDSYLLFEKLSRICIEQAWMTQMKQVL